MKGEEFKRQMEERLKAKILADEQREDKVTFTTDNTGSGRHGKNLKCKLCGEDNLHWKKIFGLNKFGRDKYLLADKYENIHYCPPKDNHKRVAVLNAQWFIALNIRCPYCEETFDAASDENFWKDKKESIDNLLYRSHVFVKCYHCGENFFCNFEYSKGDKYK